jgi:hypothetical protein
MISNIVKVITLCFGILPLCLCSNVKFINIVGIEGVGHHAVDPMVVQIIGACNGIYHPAGMYSAIQSSFEHNSPEQTKAFFTKTKPNDVFYAQFSYPAGKTGRAVEIPNDVKKNHKLYDLELKYIRLAAAGVTPKHLFLNRDLFETVASHPLFDNNFKNHTRIMGIYLTHILREFHLIDALHQGLWRRLDYADIQRVENVGPMLNAMVQFFGWRPKDCDMAGLIKNITSSIHAPRNKTIADEQMKRKYVADQIKVNVNVIPPLFTPAAPPKDTTVSRPKGGRPLRQQ